MQKSYSSKKVIVAFTLIVIFFILISGVSLAEGKTASVSAKKVSVSIWEMIVFEGDGMHRLHNVEITISNDDGFITKLLTKTTDRGVFYVPWIIPDSLEAGMYNVIASDKMSKAATSVKI